MTTSDSAAVAAVLRLEAQLAGIGGPFELAGDVDGSRVFVRGPQTLPELYARAATNGAAPLILTDRGVHSYADILAQSARIAGNLSQRCRRVALIAARPNAWVASLIAVTGAGAAAVLVGDDERHAAWVASAGCSVVSDKDADLLGRTQPAVAPPLPEHAALLSFTSGSTGVPKAIIHTHATVLAGLKSMMMLGALAGRLAARPIPPARRPARPVTMVLTQLSHVAGYSAILLAMMTGGAVAVTDDPDDPAAVARAVHRHGAQSIVGLSRDTFAQLVRLPNAEQLLASLRRLQIHGGCLPAVFAADVRARFPDLQLMTGYGMTETGGAIASAPVERTICPGIAACRLSPAVAARIVDRDDAILVNGRPGRLQVKGPMLMQAYEGAANGHAARTNDGWLETGDIGRLWPGRWLEVLGRDELGASIDEAVRLRTVEAAAMSVEGVADAVALHREQDGLHLFVESQRAAADTARMRDALYFAVPETVVAAIHVLPRLTRTRSGKVDRASLRAMMEANAAPMNVDV